MPAKTRNKPGQVRDAIVDFLRERGEAAALAEIEQAVRARMNGKFRGSSVRSYLRLNTPERFERVDRGKYRLRRQEGRGQRGKADPHLPFVAQYQYGQSLLIRSDCIEWLKSQPVRTIHAVVTDPPYGLHEYSPEQQQKLRDGKGGVWRVPPSFDGAKRNPLPRFTVLDSDALDRLKSFFFDWATALLPVLVPGANVIVASNPLLSYLVSGALAEAGLERRGEIARLVSTMRGGDRPKNAHERYSEVSVMPRSQWEPWLVFRKRFEGRVQDNLDEWKTGGFRRPSCERPFGDVIRSAPTRKSEKQIAPHPSLKPQTFLRSIVRAVLPLGEGTVLDPFAGSGSTLAACEAVGYRSIGIESDERYFELAMESIPRLAKFDG